MKKAALALATFSAMAVGMMAAAPAPAVTAQTEVRPAPSPQQTATATKSQAAIREQRSIGDAVRRVRRLTDHKNRASGERAHRRWRKRRAAGRA